MDAVRAQLAASSSRPTDSGRLRTELTNAEACCRLLRQQLDSLAGPTAAEPAAVSRGARRTQLHAARCLWTTAPRRLFVQLLCPTDPTQRAMPGSVGTHAGVLWTLFRLI